jgi:hypothetical protein
MNQPVNPVETLISQYKQGYKTSEFWVALAAGIGPAVAASFDASKPVTDQLSNLTWVAISYILARAGLKVVRTNSQAKVAVATAAPSTSSGSGDGFVGGSNGDGNLAIGILVDFRDRGVLTEDQYQQLAAAMGGGALVGGG